MIDFSEVREKASESASRAFNTAVNLAIGTTLGTVTLDALDVRADFSNAAEAADKVTGVMQPAAEVAANVLNQHPNSVASLLGLTAIAYVVNNPKHRLPLPKFSKRNTKAKLSPGIPPQKPALQSARLSDDR